MDPMEIPEIIESQTEGLAVLRRVVREGMVFGMKRRAAIGAKVASRIGKTYVRSVYNVPVSAHVPLVYGLFAYSVCGILQGLDGLINANTSALKSAALSCLEKVVALGGQPYPEFFATTTVAASVGAAITTKKMGERVQTGRIIFVYGERGCGKTTMTFWSLASPLLVLGLELMEIKKIIKTLWVTDLNDYVNLLGVAEELSHKGKSLPFIVVDDAATLLNKYDLAPFSSTKHRIEIMTELSRVEQISREGVGCVIYIASPNQLAKPIRSLAGIRVEGRFMDLTKTRLTLWVARQTNASGIIDMYATIHPHLKTPDDIFDQWLQDKLSKRRKLIQKLQKLIEGEHAEQELPEEPPPP
ncbi:MAG: hypothetical protein QXO22_04215 [Thermosphaera sp.]